MGKKKRILWQNVPQPEPEGIYTEFGKLSFLITIAISCDLISILGIIFKTLSYGNFLQKRLSTAGADIGVYIFGSCRRSYADGYVDCHVMTISRARQLLDLARFCPY